MNFTSALTPYSIFEELIKTLNSLKDKIIFSTVSEEERINSANDESMVLNLMAEACKINPFFKDFDLQPGIKRSWFDVCLIGKNNLKLSFPINIKSIAGAKNKFHNANSIPGLCYAVTGKWYPERTSCSGKWVKKEIIDNISYETLSETEYYPDYYYLVIDKHNKEVPFFWTSLKRIPRFRPNGKNEPFQIDFGSFRDTNTPTIDNNLGTERIIAAYVTSAKKAIEAQKQIVEIECVLKGLKID